jgi:hypothetical protein
MLQDHKDARARPVKTPFTTQSARRKRVMKEKLSGVMAVGSMFAPAEIEV